MAEPVITREELNKHNKPDDLWISVCGKVYDVTEYMDHHPGGVERLLQVAPPLDATKEWRRAEGGGHSKRARLKMRTLLKGSLEGGKHEQEEWLDPEFVYDKKTLNKARAKQSDNSVYLYIAALAALLLLAFHFSQ